MVSARSACVVPAGVSFPGSPNSGGISDAIRSAITHLASVPPTSIPSVPWIVETCRRTFIAIGRLLRRTAPGEMSRTSSTSGALRKRSILDESRLCQRGSHQLTSAGRP
eukprot:6798136-Prymnesium_polylepis.1